MKSIILIIIILIFCGKGFVNSKINKLHPEYTILELEKSTWCEIIKKTKSEIRGNVFDDIIQINTNKLNTIEEIIQKADSNFNLINVRLIIHKINNEWIISGIDYRYNFNKDYVLIVGFCFDKNDYEKVVNPKAILNKKNNNFKISFQNNITKIKDKMTFKFIQFLQPIPKEVPKK